MRERTSQRETPRQARRSTGQATVSPALLGVFVRIDARRPASWIALVMAVGAGVWSAADAAGPASAMSLPGMLAAAVAAVAAVGDLPLDLCPPTRCSAGRSAVVAWACERAGWPVVGFCLGALAGGGGVAGSGSWALATAVILMVAVTLAACRLSGAKAADAASLAILLAAAAIAAAVAIGDRSRQGNVLVMFVMAGTWLVLGLLGRAWARATIAAADPLPSLVHAIDGGTEPLHLDPLPAVGPMRQMLVRLAMAAALLAMAGWLMLELPQAAGHAPAAGPARADAVRAGAGPAWALFSAVWFLALAVPQATLQDGAAGAGDWEQLFRTASRPSDRGRGLPSHDAHSRPRGGGSAPRRRWRGPRLGPARFAAGVVLSQAAILGWPPLVAAAVMLPSAAKSGPPVAAVVGLAVAAVVVAAVVAFGTWAGMARETRFALASAVLAGIAGVCGACVA